MIILFIVGHSPDIHPSWKERPPPTLLEPLEPMGCGELTVRQSDPPHVTSYNNVLRWKKAHQDTHTSIISTSSSFVINPVPSMSNKRNRNPSLSSVDPLFWTLTAVRNSLKSTLPLARVSIALNRLSTNFVASPEGKTCWQEGRGYNKCIVNVLYSSHLDSCDTKPNQIKVNAVVQPSPGLCLIEWNFVITHTVYMNANGGKCSLNTDLVH